MTKAMTKGLTTGHLAERLGVRQGTLRLYERMGLIRKANRDSIGWRVYPESEVHRMKIILRLRMAGVVLPEIRDIVGDPTGWDNANQRANILAFIDKRKRELDAGAAEITRLRAELAKLNHDLLIFQNEVAISEQVDAYPLKSR